MSLNAPGQKAVPHAEDVDVPLESDIFFRTLIRELSGTLQDVVGLEEARGFINVVGGRIGDTINKQYRAAWNVSSLSKHQVADVLVDLKRRIGGDFYVIHEDEEKIVFKNRRCPFGDLVKDRPSLCMMTSNVFGKIAAENLGYARVDISAAIANRDPECMVTVHLTRTSDTVQGREYYKLD